jgi:hypothetical protein
VRVAPWPEPVREAQEVRLVDGVEHSDDGPLDDLVLQRGDAGRPQPPVRLRDIRPPRRPRLVAPAANPVMQVPEVARQVLPVVLPRHPVHSRRGLRAQIPVGHHQPLQADVMQQSREPRVLIPLCYLPHTVQLT